MNLKQRILDHDNHLSESAYLDDLATFISDYAEQHGISC
jgi:hypothetical protein